MAGPMGQFGNSRPARRGEEALEIYATGLGPVDNPPRETLTQSTVSVAAGPERSPPTRTSRPLRIAKS